MERVHDQSGARQTGVCTRYRPVLSEIGRRLCYEPIVTTIVLAEALTLPYFLNKHRDFDSQEFHGLSTFQQFSFTLRSTLSVLIAAMYRTVCIVCHVADAGDDDADV